MNVEEGLHVFYQRFRVSIVLTFHWQVSVYLFLLPIVFFFQFGDYYRTVHPPKFTTPSSNINIEPENDGSEDVFSYSRGPVFSDSGR